MHRVIRIEDVPVRRVTEPVNVPRCYDFTESYPFAQPPTQQGLCGSCWSISTTQVLRDRANLYLTKHTDKSPTVPELSYQLVADCATNCITYGGRRGCAQSCNGGFLVTGFSHLHQAGTVAERVWPSRFGHEDGVDHMDTAPPSSKKSCPVLPPATRRYRCDEYYIVNVFDTFAITNARSLTVSMTRAQLDLNELNIMREIYTRGPVAVCFNLFSDFREFWQSEASRELVYEIGWQLPAAVRAAIDPVGRPDWTDAHPGPGGIVFKTGHSVSIVGWGERSDGVKFWICRNSWGRPNRTYNKGYFRIRRGVNAAAIESDVAGCWFRPAKLFNISASLPTDDDDDPHSRTTVVIVALSVVVAVIIGLNLMKYTNR